MFWADSRLLEVVKIESWSHMEVGQCRLFFGWGVGSPLERKIIRLSPSQLEPLKLRILILILDLALAAPRVLPVGPSARKSLSRISIPSGSYNYIF